jgi:hypothetical protein
MQPGTDSESRRRPAGATRLRLVGLRTPAGTIDLGGGHAAVRAPHGDPHSVAETIARVVIGPRPAGLDGTMEIAGRHVSLQSLPAPLLAPSAAPTVDGEMLDELWPHVYRRRRRALLAVHAVHRLERHRIGIAIGRVRARAAGGSDPGPGGPVPVEPPLGIDALEARVQAAHAAAVAAGGGLPPAAKARIESRHRALVDAERVLFEAPRRERPVATARYQAALRDEKEALAAAGIDSYASFLVAIAAGPAPVDGDSRARAEAELAAARAALARARAAAEERGSLRLETEALLAERAAHERALGELAGEVARLEAQRTCRFAELEPDAARLVVEALLEAYRDGDLLAGRLPVVVGGAFDTLAAGSLAAVASAVAAAPDVQVVVVTASQHVVDAFAAAGARSGDWPAGAGGRVAAFPAPDLRLLGRRGA